MKKISKKIKWILKSCLGISLIFSVMGVISNWDVYGLCTEIAQSCSGFDRMSWEMCLNAYKFPLQFILSLFGLIIIEFPELFGGSVNLTVDG